MSDKTQAQLIADLMAATPSIENARAIVAHRLTCEPPLTNTEAFIPHLWSMAQVGAMQRGDDPLQTADRAEELFRQAVAEIRSSGGSPGRA